MTTKVLIVVIKLEIIAKGKQMSRYVIFKNADIIRLTPFLHRIEM